jgi:hypothetical protein
MCPANAKMNDSLIYTDSRPRAKATGHAFGFEGNLGMPVIVSALISIFFLNLLLNNEVRMALWAKFLIAFLPTILTAGYIVVLRSHRPPRFDADLLASWVSGRAFQPARYQPRHPLLPRR